MKGYVLILCFVFVKLIAFSQTTQTYYELRLDSTRITNFSLGANGSFNIVQNKSWLDNRINIIIIRGMRPLMTTFNYSTVAEFNKSSFTSELRKLAQPGDRVRIEFNSKTTGATSVFIQMNIID